MADQINIGDTVTIDNKGTGTVNDIVLRGLVTLYSVEISGIDFIAELERGRIEKVTVTQQPEQTTKLELDAGPRADNPKTNRFVAINEDAVGNFILKQSNKNTLSKTFYDVKLLNQFFKLPEVNESRQIHDIPAIELCPLLCRFFIGVRKTDGSEYEPTSLRGMMSSFDRQLRRNNYGHTIIGSPMFAQVREVMKSKQRQLKRDGKGNLAHKSDPINDTEIDMLWNSGQLGSNTPDSLLQTLWFYNTVHFGLRGSTEHRDMCWGDVTLRKDGDGHEFLEFTERQTKTRTGENPRDIRTVKPKLWANLENPDRCPVTIYKLYREKRPTGYGAPSDPFYAATKKILSPNIPIWFKKQPVGVNKLCTMMQRMVKLSGIESEKHLSNHSARKYLVQKLSDSNVPPTQIMQISGHKNISSINNYSHINTDQHKQISQILSSGKSALLPANMSTPSRPSRPISTCFTKSSSSSTMSEISGGFESIFSGPISGGNININIYQGGQSEPPRKRIRKAIIESDSDSLSQ